jgi:uncharacterized RDD family membrane protein YckC
MAFDPESGNETARRAFGEEPLPRATSGARPAPAAPRTATGQALAGWWTRAAAFVLDILFLISVGFVAAIIALLIAGSSDEATAELVVYAIGIPLSLAYAPLLMARSGKANGQTLGKQLMSIRVVRTDGTPVTLWNAVVRQVIGQQLLLGLTAYVYGLLDYLWPLRDPSNQCLHDKLAQTWVIQTDAAAPPPPEASPPPSPLPVDEAPVHGWLPPSAGSD